MTFALALEDGILGEAHLQRGSLGLGTEGRHPRAGLLYGWQGWWRWLLTWRSRRGLSILPGCVGLDRYFPLWGAGVGATTTKH